MSQELTRRCRILLLILLSIEIRELGDLVRTFGTGLFGMFSGLATADKEGRIRLSTS